MPKRRNARCRDCGRHREHCGVISKAGLCTACATERVAQNLRSLDAREGPGWEAWYDQWSRSVIAADQRISQRVADRRSQRASA